MLSFTCGHKETPGSEPRSRTEPEPASSGLAASWPTSRAQGRGSWGPPVWLPGAAWADWLQTLAWRPLPGTPGQEQPQQEAGQTPSRPPKRMVYREALGCWPQEQGPREHRGSARAGMARTGLAPGQGAVWECPVVRVGPWSTQGGPAFGRPNQAHTWSVW